MENDGIDTPASTAEQAAQDPEGGTPWDPQKRPGTRVAAWACLVCRASPMGPQGLERGWRAVVRHRDDGE